MTIFTKNSLPEEKKFAHTSTDPSAPFENDTSSREGEENALNQKKKRASCTLGALSIVRLTPSPLCRTPSPSPISPADATRKRLLRLLLIVLMLILLCVSFLSGYYYRQLSQNRSYSGWRGVVVNDQGNHQKMSQKMEIDSAALYEKIDVPKFGANRPAIFVHDFKQNMTAIVDVVGRRCFLKPLDRKTVSPPKNFIEMLNKMQTAYMDAPNRVVRETFKVGSAVTKDEMDALNSFIINRHCLFRPTFHLRKMSETEESGSLLRRRRRAVNRHQSVVRETAVTNVLQFAAVNGESMHVERIII